MGEYGDIFSGEWLKPSTLLGFHWENPWFLWSILATPFIFLFRWLLFFRFREKITLTLESGKLRSSFSSRLRYLPGLLLFFSLICFIIALARPQRSLATNEQFSNGIDIILALDVSESMMGEDFSPNRLEAAKVLASRFVEGRKFDRIGLVVFAGDAFSLCPLTTDYDLIKSYLENIDFSMITKPGTAIGSALGVATNRMRESKAKSKVLILMSDGENTAGNIDPLIAAGLAKAYGVKVHSIGVGSDGMVPYPSDALGNPQYMEQTMDETTLRRIASSADGMYFRATNNQALQSIFKTIDKMEKIAIKETRFQESRDFYQIYLVYGLISFLAWLLLKSTFISNPLED